MREIHNAFPDRVSELSAGWETLAEELWAETALRPTDIDLVELYDDYPIAVALQLEGYGFCGRGEAGPYLERIDLSPTGELPLNTGGGQLSVGQAGAGGGLIHVTEAVQQLQHEAGGRQVAAARRALVSGYGYISYGRGLCTAAAVLERREP
jgi:acetyl-CoA acetyltransferase